MKLYRSVTTDHKWLNIPDDKLARYNQLDTIGTALAIAPMLGEARDQNMLDYWHREVWPLVPAVREMARNGLQLDAGAKTAYRRKVRAELREVDELILKADLSGELAKPTPKYPNSLGSGAKVAKFLFGELGLKPFKTTATGRFSVDQEALAKVHAGLRRKDEHARPVVENLFHRSRLKTIDQRYLDLTADPDGRVRPTVKLLATVSGRFAYDDPPLQQYPPEIRHLFIPKPGHVFVSADYEQLEARIAAYSAGVAIDNARFGAAVDVHTETAMEVFGFDVGEWEGMEPLQRKASRNYAKSFRYRIQYGGDPDSVGALGSKTFCPCPRCTDLMPPTLNLPAPKITAASRHFLSNRPEIETWRYDQLQQVRSDGFLTNPLGLKRFFFGPVARIKREVYNWPIQSTAACIINRAMRRGWDRYRLPYVLQMHDNLMAEVPEERAEEALAQLVSVMEEPVPELGGTVFPVDPCIEGPWGTQHAR